MSTEENIRKRIFFAYVAVLLMGNDCGRDDIWCRISVPARLGVPTV